MLGRHRIPTQKTSGNTCDICSADAARIFFKGVIDVPRAIITRLMSKAGSLKDSNLMCRSDRTSAFLSSQKRLHLQLI